MWKFHQSLHPDHEHLPGSVTISQDGLRLTSGTLRSVEVISVQFGGCRCVYPVVVMETGPNTKKKDVISCKNSLVPILNQVLRYGFQLSHIAGDRPVRSDILGFKNATGYYGCDKCLIRGVLIPGKCTISNLKNFLLTTIFKLCQCTRFN